MLLLICCAASVIGLHAQTNVVLPYRAAPTVFVPVDSAAAPRRLISLNGEWRATAEEPGFSGTVMIPGAYDFEGVVTFTRTFRLDPSLQNKTMRLQVHGINYLAQIALNDEITGSHEGGYTPFVVELRAERLSFTQDNTLKITVDNRLSPRTTLPAKQRPLGWRNEGGVIREIFLEILPEIHFATLRFAYQLQPAQALIHFSAQLRARRDLPAAQAAGLRATIEVWDSARQNKLAASLPVACDNWSAGRQEVQLSCVLTQPALWAPATPNLYALRAVLAQHDTLVDEVWQETGFRTVEVSGTELRLNGAPLVLHGATWMETYNHHSLLLAVDDLNHVITTAQQLGLNALRVAGHPPHPLLPSLCDRAGLLLLEELPLYYLTEAHFRQSNFLTSAQAQARELIERDRSHPSVLAWGLGALAAPLSTGAQQALAEVAATMRKLDDRPLYTVTLPGWLPLWQRHTDFILLDRFLRRDFTHTIALVKNATQPVIPIFGQWASEALAAGRSSEGASRAAAEELQAEYFARLFETLGRSQENPGYFIATLTDWSGPMPVLAVGPRPPAAAANPPAAAEVDHFLTLDHLRTHPSGLVQAAGQNRLAFKVVQAHNRKDVNPVVVTKQVASGSSGVFQITGILLILILLYFIQRDRRLQDNLRRVFVHPHGFYIDVYENRKVAPFLTVLLGMAESAVLALLFTQVCYAFRHQLIFDHVLDLFVGGPAAKAFLVWLIWNPGWFLLLATTGFFLAGLLLALLLRLLGVFMGSSLTLSQYFTFVFWVSANLLLLAPIAPVFHRLLLMPDFVRPVLFVVACLLLWLAGRAFRVLRVIYMISFLRTALLCLLVFGGLLSALLLYYDQTQALFDYAKYYFAMAKAAG
ncbi:MAG: hypothetical protein ONB48_01755 [candidate division KSB1 bacterium]|nr:hypothetical protein [candidate division KSB1 bacterium]MDZ7272596.1 hypothetical protein [candidate division KSB1 bacterium]MDZ7284381.1 hypothetical protein [candidate division KSB1 bacterium]MDZ7297223.1 hypothetical protein [candidate division KSB1 bacterium]MDZ7308549.1 hypothetical protein [candidate division KSB1 bacterium]